jgi:CO/xanthine dehydrogenase Mo-binding subunit
MATQEFKVIGQRVVRPDGVDKVTGRAQYGIDAKQPGLLYGRILRSPHAHARIKSIDTSAAERLPGVKAVLTGKDMPSTGAGASSSGESVVSYNALSQNALAQGKVRYHGHAVAAVAATDIHIAEEALSLIKVDYEVLPHVMDVRDAMADGAPIIDDTLRTDELGEKGTAQTNVAHHGQHERGDVAKAFAGAHLVIEREFQTNTVHQGYIEPHNATAQWNADGNITVWTSTQSAWGVREQVAQVAGAPLADVRVIPMEIGGGFGGKTLVYLDPIAALLSKKAGGRPVKLTMSREEVLKATGPTSASFIRVKMGVDKQGKLVAAQAWMAYEAGGFPGSPVGAGAGVIFAPYNIPNVLIDYYDVLVNKSKAEAYRAPGGTNAAFASETVVDELADALKMDPIEFRRLNGAKEGDRRPDGPIHGKIGFLETLDAAANHPHYDSAKPEPSHKGARIGRGVASGFWFNWDGKSSASATVNPDGSVAYLEGSTDIGGLRASLAMQLAETLGLRYEDIKPAMGDTHTVGFNDATGGSRSTYGSGIAAHALGIKIIDAMKSRAAMLWDVKAEDVTVQGDVYSSGDKSVTFKELAGKLDDSGGPLTASVALDTKGAIPTLGTHIVDVEVDTDTGKIQILRYTATQDVGRAIHPSYVEGQIQGGVAQGLGWAMHEEYVYNDKGQMLNASLLDYRMPTALDLPMIDAVLIEVPNPMHPFGVKGVGEVPIVPPAAALANAIHDAIGVRMDVLPMNPRNVLKAMGKI